MAKQTKHYQLTYLEQGDVWTSYIDKNNIQIIENLLWAAQFIVENGVVSSDVCEVLSSASATYQQKFYQAALDYYNPLFFNVVKCGCQFISNEDVVADLVSISNINISTAINTLIDGVYVQYGQYVFLSNQTTASENGVYLATTTGLQKLSNQPKKVFVNQNSPSYPYSIWAINSQTNKTVNIYDCIIVVDGLTVLQNNKAVTTSYSCYILPNKIGSSSLVVYSPDKFYGTGVPILFTTTSPSEFNVNICTFITTNSDVNNYLLISNLNVIPTTSYITDFQNTTYGATDSYKILHTHVNLKNNLPLSNLEKITLIPDTNPGNICTPYDESGALYDYNVDQQSIYSFYINGQNITTDIIEFDSTLSKFKLTYPVSSGDEIYIYATKTKTIKLTPLDTSSAGTATYIEYKSNNVNAYTWSINDYNNYQLFIDNKSIDQSSYEVDNLTGTVNLVDPNNSNLNGLSQKTLQDSILFISNSTNDESSFFGSIYNIKQIYPKSLCGNYRSIGDHRHIDLTGYKYDQFLIPLYTYSKTEFKIPYLNATGGLHQNDFSDDIKDAITHGGLTAIATLSNKVYLLVDGVLQAIFEKYSDKYVNFVKFVKIKNTSNKIIAWFNDNGYNNMFGVIDRDNNIYKAYEFYHNESINDIASIDINDKLSIFFATNTKAAEIDFGHVDPRYTNLYYKYFYGKYYYSYIKSGANKIAISTDGSDYEIYLLIPELYPGSSDQAIVAVKSQTLILFDSQLDLYSLDNVGGLSDNGIVMVDTSSSYITTGPVNGKFPLTYGSRLSVASSEILCKTGSINSITLTTSYPGATIVGGSMSNLDTSVSPGDYILLRHQYDKKDNGIYLVTATAGSNFDATQQTLDTFSAGDYTYVTSGNHYENSYWELDDSQSNILFNNELNFRLRMTSFVSPTSVNKVITCQKNTTVLASSNSAYIIRDSSYVSSDTYASVSTSVTIDNLYSLNEDNNLVLLKAAILSDNFKTTPYSGKAFLNYTYPLAQGSKATLLTKFNFGFSINQLVKFTNQSSTITAVVTGKSGTNINFEIVSTNTKSPGELEFYSNNFILSDLINSQNFNQSWANSIYYINQGNYNQILSSGQYFHDLKSRSYKLTTGSAFSGSMLFAYNITSDVINSNVSTKSISLDNTLALFKYPTQDGYILEHDPSNISFKPKNPIYIDNKSPIPGTANYDGLVFYNDKQDVTSISSGSVVNSDNNLVYTSVQDGSFSIENKIHGNNVLSSKNIINTFELDNALQAAVSGYMTIGDYFSSDVNINPYSGSTIQYEMSDYESGVANYYLPGNFNYYNSCVQSIFNIDDNIYGVSNGVIYTIDVASYAVNIPLLRLDFNICYFSATIDSKVYLCTDNGLYVLDGDINLISHQCSGLSVRYIYHNTSSNTLCMAIDNSLVCHNLTTDTFDSISLECDHINTISEIYIDKENINKRYLLIGTTDGLFAATLQKSKSKQTLPYTGTGFLAAKKLTLTEEKNKRHLEASDNSIAYLYRDFIDNHQDQYLDQTGQPIIYDIVVDNTHVYLANSNGVLIYDTLYNIDLDSFGLEDQSFSKKESILNGLLVYRIRNINDTTNNFNFYSIMTNDAVYLTFDRFISCIRTDISDISFDFISVNGVWYIPSRSAYYFSSNYGENWSSDSPAIFLKFNNSHTYGFNVRQKYNDLYAECVNIPIIGLNNVGLSVKYKLDIYTLNIDGTTNSLLCSSQFGTGLSHSGMYILKFPTKVILKRDTTYRFELTQIASGINAGLVSVNVPSNNLITSKYLVSGSHYNTHIIPGVKLCTSTGPGLFTAYKKLYPSDFGGFFNFTSASGTLATPYTFANIDFVVDNSYSFLNFFGSTSNINSFIQSIYYNLYSKFNNITYNIILTDRSTSGFSTQSISGSIYYGFTGSSNTRIQDAISLAITRDTPNQYSDAIINSNVFAKYISGLQTDKFDFEFKKIIKSIKNAKKLTISSDYNIIIPTGTALNVIENGIPIDLGNFRIYVFGKDSYVPTSYYTVSGSTITFSSIPLGGLIEDIEIYALPVATYPTITSATDIKTTQSGAAFSGAWASAISSTATKIIFVLSDFTDNDSIESISDYISLIGSMDQNTYIILCGAPGPFSNVLLTKNPGRIFILPKNTNESVNQYITRVSQLLNSSSPFLASKLNFVTDSEINNFVVNYNNLELYYNSYDLINKSFIQSGKIISNTPVSTVGSLNPKQHEIYAFGSGSIVSINLQYNIPTNIINVESMINTGSYYKNQRNILKNIYQIQSNSIRVTSASGSTVQTFDKYFGISTNATPVWSPSSPKCLTTGSITNFLLDKNLQNNNLNSYTLRFNNRHNISPLVNILTTGSVWLDTFNKSPFVITKDTSGSKTFLNHYNAPEVKSISEITNVSVLNTNVLICDDKFSNTYSLNNALSGDYAQFGSTTAEYALSGNKIFKVFPESETYFTPTLDPYNVARFAVGTSQGNQNSKVTGKIYTFSNLSTNKIIKNSSPITTGTVNISKYKNSLTNIVGMCPSFNTPGYKIKNAFQITWTLTDATVLFTYACYNVDAHRFSTVSTPYINGINEYINLAKTEIYNLLDDNFTPLVTDALLLVNGSSVNSAGLNDILSLDVTVDRNDGSASSEYAYKFNIGDQIYLATEWYICSASGDQSVLVSSGDSITITQTMVDNYPGGYIYSVIKPKRGLTIGRKYVTSRVYLS